MQENTPRIARCLELLSEEQIWQRPNASSNSIANLILHLCGNITQYIYASLGMQPDTRQRDAEFDTRSGYTKAELLAQLEETVDKAIKIIAEVPEEELARVRQVQGYSMSGVGVIIHVVEHYSYHSGQIAFWTKLLRDQDLGFYADVDLNVHNE